MKIAIIGTGNVGGALAENWALKGHEIYLGVRDQTNFKGKHLLDVNGISVHSIQEAGQLAEVILIAAAPQFTLSILNELGDTSGKVIIDAMNSLRTSPEGYKNSFDALLDIAPNAEVVKCFNSTGFENMKDPVYNGQGVDMFMAGSSEKGKETAKTLALDAGFETCYYFGGDDRAALLEQFAFAWINLAIMQGHGRNMAFKILKR